MEPEKTEEVVEETTKEKEEVEEDAPAALGFSVGEEVKHKDGLI